MSPVLSSNKLLVSPELGPLKMLSPFATMKSIRSVLKTQEQAHSKLIKIAARKPPNFKQKLETIRPSRESIEHIILSLSREEQKVRFSKPKRALNKKDLIASPLTNTEVVRTISGTSKDLVVCSCGSECKDGVCKHCAEKCKFIEHRGYLYEKSNSKSLSRHWFVLIGNRLYKYKNKDDTQIIATYMLVKAFLKEEPAEHANRQFRIYPIRLYLAVGELVVYSIKGEEAKIWATLLRKAMNYLDLTDFYELGKPLGEGKFGLVRDAIHKQTGTRVAIKSIHKTKVSLEDLSLAKREIEILKVCQHPNIVPLLDTFENQDYIYIVMQLMQGGDLYDYLEKREFKVSEERARTIIHALATALFYLHSYGIVHRDIKLDNILMTDSTDGAEPKLMDFGLSKMIGPNEHCKEPFGTVGYAAPEVISGKSYDKAVDIWSLGVVLYILLTGTMPFAGESEQEIAM